MEGPDAFTGFTIVIGISSSYSDACLITTCQKVNIGIGTKIYVVSAMERTAPSSLTLHALPPGLQFLLSSSTTNLGNGNTKDPFTRHKLLLHDALMALPRIEAANALSLAVFRARFLPDDLWFGPVIQKIDGLRTGYALTLESSSTISSAKFEACFNLVASTSSGAYSASSKGWSPSKKRKEMRLPDLRYLLVESMSSTDVPIEGFVSFMLTYEDGHEVIYCYEIHLSPRLQGCRIGRNLMGVMEDVGKRAGVEKAMLTVFVENQRALVFYEKLGYSEDDFSPQPRKLRNGVIKRPDYVILSKSLK